MQKTTSAAGSTAVKRLCAIRNNFEPDIPREVIAMSSGMAVGVGKSGCICGALNGVVLVETVLAAALVVYTLIRFL